MIPLSKLSGGKTEVDVSTCGKNMYFFIIKQSATVTEILLLHFFIIENDLKNMSSVSSITQKKYIFSYLRKN